MLISGANKGIGFKLIEKFCQTKKIEEYTVILTSRNEALGNIALKTIHNLYPQYTNNIIYHQLDVTHEKSIDNVSSFVKNKYGRLNLLYNNAGYIRRNPPKEELYQEALKNFETNFFGTVKLTEALQPCLEKAGEKSSGVDAEDNPSSAHVVCVSTLVSQFKFLGQDIRNKLKNAKSLEELYNLYDDYLNVLKDGKLESSQWYDKPWQPTYGAYSISKTFVNAYVLLKAKEFKEKGVNVRINAISPGWCKTDMGGDEAPMPVEFGAERLFYMEGLPQETNGEFIDENYKKGWK